MVVRASIWDDFLKTFSPSKVRLSFRYLCSASVGVLLAHAALQSILCLHLQDNHPTTGVPGGFSGSPKHHGGREPGRAAASKPFADGYQKGGQVKLTKEEAEAMAHQEQLENGENVSASMQIANIRKTFCLGRCNSCKRL